MKCTNKRVCGLTMACLMTLSLIGCSSNQMNMPYHRSSASLAYSIDASAVQTGTAEPFAAQLCVAANDVSMQGGVSLTNSYAAGLFDLNQREVLYAKNQHEQLPPASLTKIMTAYVALKYGNLDDVITVTENCKITESGAQLFGFKPGDQVTLDQALNALLVNSANDAALVIAEHVGGGSIDEFIRMMNEEAISIGATNTHFMNPHGLTADDHYSTIYDLYLIFNQVIQYERFREIIQLASYSSSYTDASGASKTIAFETTNQYLKGNATLPENMTILGGKTGTTNAARNCLIIYSKDAAGNPYISVILSADTRENLYLDMTELLEGI